MLVPKKFGDTLAKGCSPNFTGGKFSAKSAYPHEVRRNPWKRMLSKLDGASFKQEMLIPTKFGQTFEKGCSPNLMGGKC